MNLFDLLPIVAEDAPRSSREDTSLSCSGDVSSSAVDNPVKLCRWCNGQLPAARRDRVFCCQPCRQSAFRIRQRLKLDEAAKEPKRCAYADPPYPGLSARYYADEATFAGEVDHAKLIASLVDHYDGWALSTGAYALRQVLPLCPPTARVCAWVKPIGVSPLTYGLHNTWEPLICVPCRSRRPGKRDWLAAQPARRGGSLPGRKPLAFCAWLFSLLGMQPGDALDDLFPGTGIVTRAWRELSRSAVADAGAGDVGRDPAATTATRSVTPAKTKAPNITLDHPDAS